MSSHLLPFDRHAVCSTAAAPQAVCGIGESIDTLARVVPERPPCRRGPDVPSRTVSKLTFDPSTKQARVHSLRVGKKAIDCYCCRWFIRLLRSNSSTTINAHADRNLAGNQASQPTTLSVSCSLCLSSYCSWNRRIQLAAQLDWFTSSHHVIGSHTCLEPSAPIERNAFRTGTLGFPEPLVSVGSFFTNHGASNIPPPGQFFQFSGSPLAATQTSRHTHTHRQAGSARLWTLSLPS